MAEPSLSDQDFLDDVYLLAAGIEQKDRHKKRI
jgi:hypothetical protein